MPPRVDATAATHTPGAVPAPPGAVPAGADPVTTPGAPPATDPTA